MNEVITSKQTMTSLEIAELTGKPHNDLMKAIRNMESAWVEANQGNFSQITYTDTKGRIQPCYSLTKSECLYIATKFNDVARAKLIVRWEELERKNMFGGFDVPTTYAGALQLAAKQAEQIEQQQKMLAQQSSLMLKQDETINQQTQVITQQDAMIQAAAPKVQYANAMLVSKTNILIGEMAKVLKQNGVEMGQNRFFDWLRDKHYIMSSSSNKNMPTQRAMELGIFAIKSNLYSANGEVRTSLTTTITPKGQEYFINKFLNHGN